MPDRFPTGFDPSAQGCELADLLRVHLRVGGDHAGNHRPLAAGVLGREPSVMLDGHEGGDPGIGLTGGPRRDDAQVLRLQDQATQGRQPLLRDRGVAPRLGLAQLGVGLATQCHGLVEGALHRTQQLLLAGEFGSIGDPGGRVLVGFVRLGAASVDHAADLGHDRLVGVEGGERDPALNRPVTAAGDQEIGDGVGGGIGAGGRPGLGRRLADRQQRIDTPGRGGDPLAARHRIGGAVGARAVDRLAGLFEGLEEIPFGLIDRLLDDLGRASGRRLSPQPVPGEFEMAAEPRQQFELAASQGVARGDQSANDGALAPGILGHDPGEVLDSHQVSDQAVVVRRLARVRAAKLLALDDEAGHRRDPVLEHLLVALA